MSRIATDWAWSLNLKAPQKIVMLSLADRADEYNCCYPSIQRLVNDTGLDKKTIGKWINQMIEDGLISDTGERRGPTKRVRVLRLNIELECTQKRDDSKNGNIPKNGILNDPKNGILNDPKNGLQNQSLEPVNEPVVSEPAEAASPSQPVEKIDYQKILDVYHDTLPEMAQVKILTDARKKTIRNFWKKFKFTPERWEAYLGYISENCRWMLEDRPNGRGGFWKRKNLDYLVTERCYVAVKEERANDQ